MLSYIYVGFFQLGTLKFLHLVANWIFVVVWFAHY